MVSIGKWIWVWGAMDFVFFGGGGRMQRLRQGGINAVKAWILKPVDRGGFSTFICTIPSWEHLG